jgi:hypothetical protein
MIAQDERLAMSSRALKPLAITFSLYALCLAAFAHAECSIDEIIVSGRVADAPARSSVRVQLVYPNQKVGDSGEVTLEDESFHIKIPFLTQSRAPGLLGVREKCNRKPETVVVTLFEADQEYDRVSLDLAKDFKRADPTAYTVRSEILLHGPSRSAPIR